MPNKNGRLTEETKIEAVRALPSHRVVRVKPFALCQRIVREITHLLRETHHPLIRRACHRVRLRNPIRNVFGV